MAKPAESPFGVSRSPDLKDSGRESQIDLGLALTGLVENLNLCCGDGNWAIVGGVAREIYYTQRIPVGMINPSRERKDVDIFAFPPGGVSPEMIKRILTNCRGRLKLGMSYHNRVKRDFGGGILYAYVSWSIISTGRSFSNPFS